MRRFDSVSDAYEFAAKELLKRRGGRSNTPDRDKGDGGGGPKDYDYLDAITIWCRVEACDPGDDVRSSWFELWFLADNKQPKPEWTPGEIKILTRAVSRLECLLCEVKALYPCCGHRKRGCRHKRKK